MAAGVRLVSHMRIERGKMGEMDRDTLDSKSRSNVLMPDAGESQTIEKFVE